MNLLLNLGYTIMTRFIRYMTSNRSLQIDNIKVFDDEEFQIISPDNNLLVDHSYSLVKYDLKSMMPIIYNKYIDEAVKKYRYPEMIIKRFPDYGFMSVYMIHGLSPEQIDALSDSIYLRRCEDRVLIEYQGKHYEWYWVESVKDRTNFNELMGEDIEDYTYNNVIFGPDQDILTHFRDKPDYTS